MAYNKFTYKNVREKLGIKFGYDLTVFTESVPIAPREILYQLVEVNDHFPLTTEIARREWIIGNIFREFIEVSGRTVSVYSGETLDADPALGLVGEADYIITRGKAWLPIEGPIIAVAEAKKNELLTGIGQCIAEMVGARIYNEKGGTPVNRIFGVVTTGLLWGFMVLEGNEKEVKMDPREYTLSDLDEILGILVYMSENA